MDEPESVNYWRETSAHCEEIRSASVYGCVGLSSERGISLCWATLSPSLCDLCAILLGVLERHHSASTANVNRVRSVTYTVELTVRAEMVQQHCLNFNETTLSLEQTMFTRNKILYPGDQIGEPRDNSVYGHERFQETWILQARHSLERPGKSGWTEVFRSDKGCHKNGMECNARSATDNWHTCRKEAHLEVRKGPTVHGLCSA